MNNKNGILNTLKRSIFNNVSGSNRGIWNSIIRDPFPGAWQQNKEQTKEDILAYPAVFACITLIAQDIAKLPIKLVKKDSNGIWVDYDSPAFSPVLRKPNRYQTRLQFFESWVLSILIHGNTYVLKVRDARNIVVGLYILDPQNVQVLISDSGEIWYQLNSDTLSDVSEPITVPDTEIIHDRVNTLYHPLVGISPIYAAGMSVLQGRNAQESASHFFKNRGQPGGILTAPGALSDETVEQLRAYWAENYTGNNAGRVAVLADGLTYKSFDTVNAQTAQLIEQLNWTAQIVCSVFHVPPYKIGAGDVPTSGNIENENLRYFAEALQNRIENIEVLLDEGLSMPKDIGVEFDTPNLFRMDSKTLIETQALGTKAGIIKPDEARKALNKPPVEGGDTVYLQEQNYSLAALARRDAREDPFEKGSSNNSNDSNSENNNNQEEEDVERFFSELRIKAAERFIYAK